MDGFGKQRKSFRWNGVPVYLLLSFLSVVYPLYGQADNDPPDAPVLILVTVHPETGFTELKWTKSIAPDAAGYIVYYFRNGEGFAFDTLRSPLTTDYINTGSGADLRSEAYVVASFDTAGNVSPLSNRLETIFSGVTVDTCRSSLTISWNSYIPEPAQVTGYRIRISENGGTFYTAGITSSVENSFTFGNIRNGSTYCLLAEALLPGDDISSSNKACVTVNMQTPPLWINADYATVDQSGKITLSFTIDPASEINNYRLERKEQEDPVFSDLANFKVTGKTIQYTDESADVTKRYTYRLAAINNCGIPAIYSNPAGNITALLEFQGERLKLSWNRYTGWRGIISEQTIMADYGNGYGILTAVSPADSVLGINYSEIMYRITGSEVCFYISANEASDTLGFSGSSRSNSVCTGTEERIFSPNAFTPGGDNINDSFRPLLSFLPVSYLLVITDRNNNILFESRAYDLAWDGTVKGSPVPPGLYLWYLKVKTPSGRQIQKSGTVTIIRNR